MEYLKWQQKEGGRRTIQDFADYLDVDRPTLSVWMNGKRVPDDRNVEKLA
jgi:transcriptional regulator with XRE-family HTH domain